MDSYMMDIDAEDTCTTILDCEESAWSNKSPIKTDKRASMKRISISSKGDMLLRLLEKRTGGKRFSQISPPRTSYQETPILISGGKSIRGRGMRPKRLFSESETTQENFENPQNTPYRKISRPRLESLEESRVREKYFKCSACNLIFATADSLTKHLKYHRTIVKNIADRGISYPRLESLEECREREKEFKCSSCNLIFATADSLTEHLKCHLTIVRNPAYRESSYQRRESLVESREREKEFKCSACNLIFATADYLTEHLKHHRTTVNMMEFEDFGRGFKCNACGLIYATADCLAEHMTCHGTFDKMLQLDSMSVENNRANKEWFECSACKLIYATSDSLLTHLHYHRTLDNKIYSWSRPMQQNSCLEPLDLRKY